MINTDFLFTKKINLLIRGDEIIVKNKNKTKAFLINKTYKKTEPLKNFDKYNSNNEMLVESYGILGIIEAHSTSYLLVIKSALFIGCIIKSEIYKVEEVLYVPMICKVSTDILPEDATYIKMFEDFLKRNALYFSDSYDLTNSVKSFYEMISIKINKIDSINTFSFQEVMNYDFCWNYNLMKNLDITRDILLPVICGYLNITTYTSYSKEFNYIIISRRNTRRAGIRYHRRGSDLQGNTDNYYETEQIVTFLEEKYYHIISYYMIRGSLPLLWSQLPTLKYTPEIRLNSNFLLQVSTLKKHHKLLIEKYNKVVLVNLLSKRNEEKNIVLLLEEVIKEINKDKEENVIDFHNLDFNLIFGERKTDKKLINEWLKSFFQDYSLTHLIVPYNFIFSEYTNYDCSKEIIVQEMQKKVYRFNCIDCIDRTNYTQYYISREVLFLIISKYLENNSHFKVKHTTNSKNNDNNIIPFNKNFESIFKFFWMKNGDQLALSYCGTPSFTSILIDNKPNSKLCLLKYKLERFYNSNFKDGYNQDCLDYSLGLLSRKNTNFIEHSIFPLIYFVIANIIAITFQYKLVISIAFPLEYEDNLRKKILRFMFLICFSYLSLSFFINNYKDKIIDKPSKKMN